MASAQANVQALTQELQKQGLPPQEIQRQMLMLLAQLGKQTGLPAPGLSRQEVQAFMAGFARRLPRPLRPT